MAIPGMTVRRELEFKVRREDWSKYEALEGQALIWVRHILVKLVEIELPPGVTVPKGQPYAMATQNVVTALFRDPSLKGPPSAEPVQLEELATGGEELPLTLIDEPFNEYVASGKPPQLVRMKCVATDARIHRKRFNGFGDPFVYVNSQAIASPSRDARPNELL